MNKIVNFISLIVVFNLMGCSINFSDRHDAFTDSRDKKVIKKEPVLYGNFSPTAPKSSVSYSLTVVSLNGEKFSSKSSKVTLIPGNNTIEVIYNGCPMVLLFASCAIFSEKLHQKLMFVAEEGQYYDVEKGENIVVRNRFRKTIVSKIL